MSDANLIEREWTYYSYTILSLLPAPPGVCAYYSYKMDDEPRSLDEIPLVYGALADVTEHQCMVSEEKGFTDYAVPKIEREVVGLILGDSHFDVADNAYSGFIGLHMSRADAVRGGLTEEDAAELAPVEDPS
jgi:hypothetical protein